MQLASKAIATAEFEKAKNLAKAPVEGATFTPATEE
jgi:hypothetical protein